MTPAQDLFFASLVALARRHHLQVPRLSPERANFGEPEMMPGILEVVGFKNVKMTEMVTGGRAKTAEAWMELMAGAGPLPFTMLNVLGPELRRRFAKELKAPDTSPIANERINSWSFYSDRRKRGFELDTFFDLFGAKPQFGRLFLKGRKWLFCVGPKE